MIYFDNCATTPLHPEVLDAMLPFLQQEYGNPSSKYYPLAENAKNAVSYAREKIAMLLNCIPEEVVFTSGATESNNMILKGIADPFWGTERQIITSKTEHSSVLDTVHHLRSKGFHIEVMDVDRFGRVSIEKLKELVSSNSRTTLMVSILWGNNELGTLNNIKEIAEFCQNHSISIHSDATQVVGKMKIDLDDLPLQFLSLSSHKLHGPKGIGAAIIKKDKLGIRTPITPLLHGGGQEFGYRSGTLNVPAIVGFGKAAEIANRDLESNIRHLEFLDTYFISKLQQHFSEILHFNSNSSPKLPGILNIRFAGIHNELLIKKIAAHVAISSGSACSSSKPSHVLQSIGCSLDEVRSSIRVSFSKYNNIEEIDTFINLLSS
ncbi:cysteine desulfurase DndA [Paenibacillus sp. Soil766]|uniref:cysteine desulfurase family protein n=1 Tax=Paenibacillus sp. Soil766 TaxID=1736404 RepID=UPI00070C9825|nr:cysteine desulfurase family protein [Paenibacillus sp. Soil766]KRF01088.1 cysteine desulfurase DndA [Paenibacillus sp. Soil766]